MAGKNRAQWTTDQEKILVEFIHKESLNGTAKNGCKQWQWRDGFWNDAATFFLDDGTKSPTVCQKQHYRLRYVFRDVRKILKFSKGFKWDDKTSKVVAPQKEWDNLVQVDRHLFRYGKRQFLWYRCYEDIMKVIGDRLTEPKSEERLAADADDEAFRARAIESDDNADSLFDDRGEVELDNPDSEGDSDSLFVSERQPKITGPCTEAPLTI